MSEKERHEARLENIGKAQAIGLAKGCLMAAREVRKGQTLEAMERAGIRYRSPADRWAFFERYLNEAAEWRRYAALEAIKP